MKRRVLRRAPMGWHDAGFGISDATDAYVVFDLVGEDAADVLAEGGVLVNGPPSPSAAITFAGTAALVVRQQQGFRIWVPRAAQIFVASFFK